MQGAFLQAIGMLIHIPSIKRINLPSDRYFLDCYDFTLGLAVKEIGDTEWKKGRKVIENISAIIRCSGKEESELLDTFRKRCDNWLSVKDKKP